VARFFSSTFLAFFVVIFQALFCLRNKLYFLPIPDSVKRLLVHRYIYFLIGASTGASLIFEDKKRRGELALYVTPKAMEGAWRGIMKEKSGIVPFGEIWLTGAGMAMLMNSYRHEPTAMSSLVRKILYQFVGPN